MTRGCLHRPRILVVEDEPLIGLVLAEMLTELEYEVIGPMTGVRDTLAALATSPRVDAAILDFYLQTETCIPIADALAEQAIPFAFSSGCSPEDLRSCGHLAAHVLTKPYRMRHVLTTLNRLLDPRPAADVSGSASSVQPAAP